MRIFSIGFSIKFFFIVSLSIIHAKAQLLAPTFHTYTKENGISHVSTADVAEDKYGFLWFASQSGVDKFDGYTFKNFGIWQEDESSGLQSLTALQIEASLDGQYLWVGTYSGLSKINVDTEKFTHYTLPSKTPYDKPIINRLKLNSDGQLWIISERNLYHYSPIVDKFELIAVLPSDTSTLTDVEQVGTTLYVTSTAGLYKLDQVKKRLQLIAFEDTNFTRIAKFTNSRLWLGTTSSGVCLYDINNTSASLKQICTSTSSGLSSNYVNDLLVRQNNDVWIATERGLNILMAQGLYAVLPAPFHHSNQSKERASSVFETSSGLIVATTKDDGFAISNPSLNKFYSKEVGQGRITPSVANYKNNLVWVSNEQGLWLYSPIDGSVSKQYEPDKSSNGVPEINNISSVYYVEQTDTLWLATRTGLSKLNWDTKKIDIIALQGKAGYSINVDDDNDVWYGGFSDGVFIYRPSSNTIIKQWPLPLTTHILMEDANTAWIATVSGLYFANKITGELVNVATFTDKLSEKTVFTWISRSKRGGYWVGTQAAGLYYLTMDGNDFSTFKVTQIKPESHISEISIGAIIEDDGLGLWISTTEGIAYLAPNLSNLSYFDDENGAISAGYYIGSAAVTDNNIVLFGGNGGITQFMPTQVEMSNWSPKVQITEIEVVHRRENNGSATQSYNLDQPLELNAEDIALSVMFSATDYMNANKLRYAYKLEDFETNWRFTDHKARVATYTNLAPGSYKLTVKVINNENVWSTDQAQLEIVVVPPWWEEPLWRILFVWIILLLIVSIIWLRISSLKKRAVDLALKVEEKTRDLEAVVKKLTLISTQDSLTGLKNRRYFNERVQKAWLAYKRHGVSFSLLSVDIDFFKRINDTYGHHVGDEVLMQVANTLENSLRESDIIARWGGEEFLILLPSINLQQAYSVAEKLRERLAALNIVLPPHEINITITCGVADIRDYNSLEACIHAVDEKLYKGKASGRNTVVK